MVKNIKFQFPAAIDDLAGNLSLSELNTLLMEVFRQRSRKLEPAVLLDNYRRNRFVKPSSLDPVKLYKIRLEIIEMALSRNFIPLELSPLAPFGACSAIAPVDQNNIVSALRGTEVMSDPTNVLAFEAGLRRKRYSGEEVNLCSVHRAVRAQSFDNPDFSAHFEVFCMVSAGKDRGNFSFEKEMLARHIRFYLEFLKRTDASMNLSVLIIPVVSEETDNQLSESIINHVKDSIAGFPVSLSKAEGHSSYYKMFRFNILLKKKCEEHLIVDGGFTDWSQQLLNNKKERLMTSGLGMEYLLRIMNH